MKTSLLIVVLAAPLAMRASEPPDAAVLARAEALLHSADAKLVNAKSLHAVYTEVDAYPGEYRDLKQTGTITLVRPGRVRLEIVRARRVNSTEPWKDSGNNTLNVSDGRTAYAVFFHPHSTQVRKVGSVATPKLEEAPFLKAFFGNANSIAAQLQKTNAEGKLEAVEVQGSQVRFKTGALDRTVEVGDDGLIHRLSILNERTGASKTWTLQSVTLDSPIPEKEFRYQAPKDALPFPAAEKSLGISVGADAPDIEVQSRAGTDLHLSQFKGKVVLLKFWATWCWPCNQSLPETEDLVAKYREKGVEGLAVAIKDSRKGFDAWLKKHPQYVNLTFAFDDPIEGKASEAFLNPTTPTLYVVGKDGRVVAKFEGFTGPNPAIEKAVLSAL